MANFLPKIVLADFYFARRNKLFFETNERLLIQHRSQMSGNPVKIRDGCATVTGDKLPVASQRLRLKATVPQCGTGRRERG
jgi:hypothetical protein